jgi:dienelactone hydrolase
MGPVIVTECATGTVPITMARKWLAPPAPPSAKGEAEGRPYLVWLPKTEPPWPGMVIVHGAGSSKENHADFGRRCAAAGWAALAYDQRGHGDGSDEMSPDAVADCGRMARVLGEWDGVDAGRICARGSSMGGFVALHAAATSPAIGAVIAICPAGEEHLLRGLRDGSLEFRAGDRARGDLEAWLGEHDLRDAIELMGSKPKILIHAAGDERIPSEFSAELHERAAEPRKLVIVPGGHHRSAQHDAELQGIALRWIERQL